MATVFWDAKGVLLIDYLEKGTTINSEYYCNLLDQLHDKIREKRPGLQKKKSFSSKTMHPLTQLKKPLRRSLI